jgi:hypothetical protein
MSQVWLLYDPEGRLMRRSFHVVRLRGNGRPELVLNSYDTYEIAREHAKGYYRTAALDDALEIRQWGRIVWGPYIRTSTRVEI